MLLSRKGNIRQPYPSSHRLEVAVSILAYFFKGEIKGEQIIILIQSFNTTTKCHWKHLTNYGVIISLSTILARAFMHPGENLNIASRTLAS